MVVSGEEGCRWEQTRTSVIGSEVKTLDRWIERMQQDMMKQHMEAWIDMV